MHTPADSNTVLPITQSTRIRSTLEIIASPNNDAGRVALPARVFVAYDDATRRMVRPNGAGAASHATPPVT